MKTVIMACLLVVMGLPVAASVGDEIENVAKAVILQKVGEMAADALNRREAVKPAPAPGQIGTIRIEVNSGWYGQAQAVMQKACEAVGLVPVVVADRAVVAEEAEIGGCPVVTPAEYIGRLTLWQGDGRWSSTEVRDWPSRYRIETDRIWAHAVFTVTRQGLVVAVAEVEASDKAISIDACRGWWGRGFEVRTQEPTRQDLAVAAACQKAANVVAAKLAPRCGWRFDPATGQSLPRESVCSICGHPAPAGANFCPFCGSKLGLPAPTTTPPPPSGGGSRDYNPGE